MKQNVREAIADTVQGLIDIGAKTSFTQREINALGVGIKPVKLTPTQIRAVRQRRKRSQAVFAKVLNVSPSALRQWEQGARKPTGSTQVLLELVSRQPNIFDYRLK